MKRPILLLAAATMALLGSGGAMAALAVGAKAPDFTTRGAQAGKTFTLTLAHQLKRGPVVLYFFPKAFTPGCSCSRDHEASKFPAELQDGVTPWRFL